MSSRSVTSPVGARIEIVSDDDWAATAGVSTHSLRMWSRSKPVLIRELWEHGAAEDKGGGAMNVLFERMQEHYPNTVYKLGRRTALNALMTDPSNAAAFAREIRGKRTFLIELVAMPEIWYQKLRWDIGGSQAFTATPVNGSKPIEAPQPLTDESITTEVFVPCETPIPTMADITASDIVESLEPAIEVEIASQVAMQLLTTVVEIISAGTAAGADPELRKLRSELVHSQGLLSERLSENDRMRKQLRETGDELRSIKLERDGLRQRLRQTEANLTSALKGESAHAVTTEVMKRVDRIMRETPKPNRGEE